MDEMRILSPTAILGYGFPMESFEEGMKRKPHIIAVDAGSTDPGPYYLGAGISFTDRNAVKRDLAIMLPAALKANIPLVIGSAGGCGADSHLNWNVDIIKEIAAEQGLHFKMAVISAEIKHETVKAKLAQGKVHPLHSVPEVDAADVDESVRIVAQMGPEPFIKALDQGAQVVIAGRAYDPAVFACLAIKEGMDPGLATHVGKILECAAIAATPGSGSDCMFGILRRIGHGFHPGLHHLGIHHAHHRIHHLRIGHGGHPVAHALAPVAHGGHLRRGLGHAGYRHLQHRRNRGGHQGFTELHGCLQIVESGKLNTIRWRQKVGIRDTARQPFLLGTAATSGHHRRG